MDEVPRIILTAHDGTSLGDLDPAQVAEIIAVAEINGENHLSITTTEELSKGDRLLYRDGMNAWHEYVVEGIEGGHETGDPLHTYYCPWSIQHDLAETYVSSMPGTGGTPATATQALTAALAGTARWTVGTVDVTTTGSASFYRTSGWEALQTLVATWGGEVEASITVGLDGVTARAVNLLQHVGATTATRRFDYGGDLAGIKRTVSDERWTARVIPLGAAQETTGGGYGRKVDISTVNGGTLYLEDADAVPLTRIPDGNGGWEVPVQIVENDTIETPAALKQWATDNLETWTKPKVSYEATVVQLAGAGMSAQGIEVGDACAVVDRDFGATPIRITTRLLRIEENLLDRAQSALTFSNLVDGLGSQLADIARSAAAAQSQITNLSLNQSTAAYISALLQRINAETNATGGYTYITEGEGIRTYDVAVSDPLVGSEASQVIEIKGGTWRIANSKDGGGNWEWRTVATGAGIIADEITSGTINASLIKTGTLDASLVTIANLLMIGYAAGANVKIQSGGLVFTLPYDDGNGHTGTVSASMYPQYTTVHGINGGTVGGKVFVIKCGSAIIEMSPSGITDITGDLTSDTLSTGAMAGSSATIGTRSANNPNGPQTSITGERITVSNTDQPYVRINNNPAIGRDISLIISPSGTTSGIYDHENAEWILCKTSGGEVYVDDLQISHVGTTKEIDESDGLALVSDSWASITSITLDAGVWVVSYGARFGTNSTGRRGAFIGKTSGVYNATYMRQGGFMMPAASGTSSGNNGTYILQPTSSTTYYLNAYQNSGGFLTTTGSITAVRIK